MVLGCGDMGFITVGSAPFVGWKAHGLKNKNTNKIE